MKEGMEQQQQQLGAMEKKKKKKKKEKNEKINNNQLRKEEDASSSCKLRLRFIRPGTRASLSMKFDMILMSLQLLLICCACAVSGQGEGWDGVIITELDYQALQAFKHEMVDPNGFLRSWNDSGFGACSGGWTGIKCAQGQVIVLQLPWKGLGGRITDKIGQLQALRKLSLHDNSIGGQIPSSLGFLPNLRGLQLFNNRLSGSIPPSLGGGCPLLQTLDLSNNFLLGSIPENLINSTTTKLYRLNLSYNSILGPIPFSLTQSQTLMFLDLQHNNLTGSIPDSWGPSHRLTTLDLSYNAINGSLPSSFSNLSSSLVSLNLKRNQLDGQIPESLLGNISTTTLTSLDLSLNNFSGEIPVSLGGLNNLKFLNMSYNNLSGQVPTALSQKFNSSSFMGNVQLCGFRGSSSNPLCPSPPPSQAPSQLVPPGGGSMQKKRKHRHLGTKDIILIAAGVLLAILLILCCVLLYCLIRKRAAPASRRRDREGQLSAAAARAAGKGIPPSSGGKEAEAEAAPGGEAAGGGKLVHFEGPGTVVFTADDLLCATAEILGKSTYGTVYKATLEDGSEVAVKRLREKITKQGQREFESEVNVLGMIRHPNLLPLRAYYVGPKGEKLLVFDYMPRGSLSTFLHSRGPDTPIDWAKRKGIIEGMARGLCHLHHVENLIHGNLTSNNVLLDDDDMTLQSSSSSSTGGGVRISDYGLSRLMNPSAGPNVIAAAAALGYRAPELSKLKKANAKTDIYSFGVIVLEILTGKSPGDAMMHSGGDLPQWVASIVKEEWTNEVFDVELMSDAATIGDELLNTLKLALHCVDPSPAARPDARQIVQQLQEIHGGRGGGGGEGGSSTSGGLLMATGASGRDGGGGGGGTGTHSVQSD